MRVKKERRKTSKELLRKTKNNQYRASQKCRNNSQNYSKEEIYPSHIHLPNSQQTFLVFQDILKTSCSVTTFCLPRRLPKTPSRCLEDVFNTSSQDVFKTFSRRLQEVFTTCLQDAFFEKSSRRLQEEVLQLLLEDVLEGKNTLH